MADITICILGSQPWHYLNNAFYKLDKNLSNYWCLSSNLSYPEEFDYFETMDSDIAGSDLEILMKGGSLRPSSSNCLYLSLSLNPLSAITYTTIYVFILFEFMFIIIQFMYLFNSLEFMYLLFLNTCTYYFWLLNCFYVFIYYYFETCLLLYPFYDLMIFIYNPKEPKLSSRMQYK